MMVPGFLDDGSKAFLKSWNLRSPSVAAFWSKPEIRLADVGVGPDLGGRPLHQHAAGLQDVGPVAISRHSAMRCSTIKTVMPASRMPFDRGKDLIHELWHDALRRFVEHQQPWPRHQHAPDREHLLLAAKERFGAPAPAARRAAGRAETPAPADPRGSPRRDRDSCRVVSCRAPIAAETAGALPARRRRRAR